MNKILKFYLSFLILIMCICFLTGCGNKNDSNNNKNFEEKIGAEISYVDEEIVYMINALNDIDYERYKVAIEVPDTKKGLDSGNIGEDLDTQEKSKENGDGENSKKNSENVGGEGGTNKSDEGEGNKEGNSSGEKAQEKNEGSSKSSKGSESNSSEKLTMKSNDILGSSYEVNWETLRSKVENLYTTWVPIANDLEKKGIPAERLDEFVKNLDNVSVAVKEENKENAINSLISLYALLPNFVDNADRMEKNILTSKYNLLLCYRDVNLEEWDKLQSEINNLKMSFTNVSSQKEKYKGKESNIDNALIILKEISNSANTMEKDVFFIKYKNLMQELNSISNM